MKKVAVLLSILTLLSAKVVNAQGGDNCAVAAGAPIAIPFAAFGQSTCAALDNYDAPLATMPAPTCIDPGATQGNDWLYNFTAATSGQILITLNNVAVLPCTPGFPSISVWQGCPNVGTCVEGAAAWSQSNTIMMQFTAVAGQNYYVMIDCWPVACPGPPTIFCITYDITINYVAAPAVQPSCTNMGFESGSFAGWYGTQGRTTISCGYPLPAPRPDYDLGAPGMPSPMHTLMTGAGVDPCGGFPVVCPFGGTTSVRLGDVGGLLGPTPLNVWNGSSTLEQTFLVTAANAYLTYWYAVVIQNASTPTPHPSDQQPFFQIETLDALGNPIACGQYLVVGGASVPGFSTSPGCIPLGTVYYRGWTPVALDLSSQIGSTITLRFVQGDCCLSGHYSYAYLDFSACQPLPVIPNVTVCSGNPGTLTAPPGFLSYAWSTGATTQTLTVSPTVTTTYTVTLTSLAGPGCQTVLTASVIVNPAVTATTTSTNVLCFGLSTGTGTATPAAGTPGFSYSWNTIPVQTAQTATSLAAGTYTVTVTDLNGCTTTATVTVTQPPAITITPTSTNVTCAAPNTGTATATPAGGTPGYTYSWNSVPAQTTQTATGLTAGTYTVIVTDLNGCTSSITAVVATGGSPVTANFAAAAVCLNNPTTFNDLSVGGPTNWSWDFGEPASGPANFSILQNPIHTYGAPGTYTVTLICYNTNPACADTIIITVTVNPLPTPLFSATTVCAGQPTTFTDLSTIATGTITTWNWNFGDPASGPANISTLQSPTHVFSAAGTYTVILTTTSNNGCQNTVSVTVTVNPLPVASFTAPAVCVNNITAFTNTSTGGISWSWNFGDGSPLDLNQNPVHTYTVAGTYNTTLTVTGTGGCSATATLAVTVNPGPLANFAATSVCVGQPTTFTDLSTIPAGSTITGWSWDFGDGSPLNTTQNPVYTYAAAGNYNVTIITTSNNGCTDTVTLPVTVYPLPVAAFTNTTPCEGVASVFTDGSTVSVGTIIGWSWNFGDGSPLNTTQNPSHPYATAGTYNVTLTVTSNNGCTATVIIPITVNPNPVANFTANDTDGCAMHCVDFFDLSTITVGTITTWYWQFGDAGTSTLQNPSHCYSIPGTYDVTLTVTSSTGCTDIYVNNTYIVVYPIPVADFSVSPQPTNYYNTTIYFTDLSLGNPIQWWWTFGDGDSLSPLTQNPIHLYPETGAGTYTATLIIENQYGCRDTIQKDIVIDPIFTFYIPNCFTPNGDNINDFFFGSGVGIIESEIWIFDRWGNLIFNGEGPGLPQDQPKVHWNGKVQDGRSNEIAQIDVYVWLVKLTDVFNKKHRYVGHVSIIK